jgi:hypothetical protein
LNTARVSLRAQAEVPVVLKSFDVFSLKTIQPSTQWKKYISMCRLAAGAILIHNNEPSTLMVKFLQFEISMHATRSVFCLEMLPCHLIRMFEVLISSTMNERGPNS